MQAIAKLNKLPFPPRKIRLVVNLIRGMEVTLAINILKHQTKKAAQPIHKLLLSVISNWKQKTKKEEIVQPLYISKIYVDGGSMLKRIKPAPRGRAHHIRRRSGHLTIAVSNTPTTSHNKKLKPFINQ